MLLIRLHEKKCSFATLSMLAMSALLAACGGDKKNSASSAPSDPGVTSFRLDAPSQMTFEAKAFRTPLELTQPVTVNGAAPITITNNAPRDYPLGDTTVTWSARDVSGRAAQLAQTISIVDRIPPLLKPPADVILVVDKSGTYSIPLGAPSAYDALDGMSITRDGPTEFPLGTTEITWKAVDQSGNASTAIQRVVIELKASTVDTIPPTITAPADIAAVSTDGQPITITLGTPTTSDNRGAPTVTNDAPTQFAVGLTLVNWTAVDAAGNRVVATQRVAVTASGSTDKIPPTLTLTNATAIGPIEATAAVTAVDIGTASAQDDVDGTLTARNDAPATGFPVGTTTVTWYATDNAGNSTFVSQTVTVSDTTPPVITAPADIEQVGDRSKNLVLIGTSTASDIVDGAVVVVNNAPIAGFPIGASVVTWTATDRVGNIASVEQRVNLTAAACSASLPFFSENVWPQILSADCLSCHTSNGVTSAFNLVDASVNDFLNQNFDITSLVIKRKDAANRPLLLSKSSNTANDHGGGARFATTDPRYLTLEEFSDRMTVCADDRTPLQQGLVLTSPYQHLRRATLSVAGRLPTAAEEATVAATTTPAALTDAVNSILDTAMTEPLFYERVKEIYNDLLLTNAVANNSALLLDFRNYENQNYFDNAKLSAQGYSGADIIRLRDLVGQGIGYAPLELIAYVVKNDKPFTEILTADYVMVNPYTATLFSAVPSGTTDFGFVYGNAVDLKDAADFRPAVITDRTGRRYPHSGVINTLAFLGRYPSTATNRNRARARYVFKYFLDTDVEGLANRGNLDLERTVGEFPTLQDPQCKACHDTVDPVAGLFKNWSNEGGFEGDRLDWFSELTPPQMLKPGYTISDLLPSTDSMRAEAWLGARVATDNRFALSTVKTVAGSLLGPAVLQDAALLEELKTSFVSNGFNFKSLVKRIINTNYFRAMNISASDIPASYASFGIGRLLTPEQLDRKITSVFGGYNWRSPGGRGLRQESTYLLLYGGIDSSEVTERTTMPTGLMAAIQDRLAYQIGCEATATDFARPAASRLLFTTLNITDTPALATPAIRATIQALHKRILGEELAVDDPEVTRTFELFVAALTASVGKTLPEACAAGLPATDPIRQDAQGTVQAWLAVTAYLLSDFRFYFD